jgi:hypothetical protein
MAPKQKPRRKYKKQTSLTVVKLISGILAGKTKKQAALDAGLSRKNPKYASQAAHLALSRAIERTPDLMDKNGLTTDSLIENELIPLLHATQIKVFQHHGKVKSAVEVADNVTRKDALDMAFRLHGACDSQSRRAETEREMGMETNKQVKNGSPLSPILVSKTRSGPPPEPLRSQHRATRCPWRAASQALLQAGAL